MNTAHARRMVGAFAYLIGTSARNRLVAQLKRIRNPRYAVAAIVGILYFVLIFGTRSGSGRSAGGASPIFGGVFEALAPVLLLLLLGSSWIFGGDQSALAFTQGEVSMLFTAPVSRRTLLLYKLARSQVTIAVSVVIWSLLFRRGTAGIPGVLSALSFWSVFTTMTLHRLGAALVRASTFEHGKAGARRAFLPIVVMVFVVVVMMAQVTGARTAVAGETNPFDFLNKLGAFVSSDMPAVILYPFRAVVAPVFAHSAGAWASAMLPALGVLALHMVWVLRSDAAFEEAAAVASSERAKLIESMRQRRSGIPAPKAAGKTRVLPLGPMGRPAVAIFWKNIIALQRAARFGMLLMLLTPLVLITVVVATSGSNGKGDAALLVAVLSIAVAAMLVILGGRTLRNDLRSDMLQLPMLKSLPLSGAELVLAEVASGALPLAAMQFALVGVSFVAVSLSAKVVIAVGVRVALLVAAPFVLVALNMASLTLLNGTAVLFPGWIQLGATGPGGFEAMGQQILTTLGTMLALLMLLLIPGALAGVLLFVLGPATAAGIIAGAVVGSVVLAVETYALIHWLGGVFERAEPSHVAL